MNRNIKAAAAAVLAAPVMAMAALPTAVTTEFDTIKTDLGTVGGLVIACVLVLVAFAWIRKGIGGGK